MGQTQSEVTWQEEAAEAVRNEILVASHGSEPQTEEAWEAVAARFGCSIVIHPDMRPSDACMIDNVIHVPALPRTSPNRHNCYAHEIAEAVTLWEGREPMIVPAHDMQRVRHEIARRVERAR